MSELGPGAAYSRLRDMEPDPSDMKNKKTLSSLAREQLNYLHPFMSEVESLDSMDPRAEDIAELYFQLIERLNAVLQMRESGRKIDPFMSGGPEDDHFDTEHEFMYHQIMRVLEKDLDADPYVTGKAHGYGPSEMREWLELWQGALEHIRFMETGEGGPQEYDQKGNPIDMEEEFYDPSDYEADEIDPERNYISGDFLPEPDYYDPAWGDSMKEDY